MLAPAEGKALLLNVDASGCFDPPCLVDFTTIPSRTQDRHSLTNAADLSTIKTGLPQIII